MASSNVRIDSLFLDEGFGTLDDDSLEKALNALSSLNAQGKTVGLISHVDQIKERIPSKIIVKRSAQPGVSRLEGAGVKLELTPKLTCPSAFRMLKTISLPKSL